MMGPTPPNPVRSGPRPASRRDRLHAAALLALSLLAIGACARTRDDSFARGKEQFLANHLEESLALFDRAARLDPRDADARAWAADAHRRLGHHDLADSLARVALRLAPGCSFSHEVLGANFDPMYSGWPRANADSSWFHFLAAVANDSTNGSAWTGVWLRALSRNERGIERLALRSLGRTQFFTPSLLAYARWLLGTAPPRAVLLVSGDMDTYPLAMLQETEGLRTDVVIANLSLLNLAWYRRMLRDRAGVAMPFGAARLDTLNLEAIPERDTIITASDRLVAGWFDMVKRGTLGRPLAASNTVSRLGIPREHLVLEGAYWQVARKPAAALVDTAAVRASLASIAPADFTGPWISDKDPSPVRRMGTGGFALNVLAAALQDVAACRTAGDAAGANAMVAWGREFIAGARVDSAGREMFEKAVAAATPAAP